MVQQNAQKRMTKRLYMYYTLVTPNTYRFFVRRTFIYLVYLNDILGPIVQILRTAVCPNTGRAKHVYLVS